MTSAWPLGYSTTIKRKKPFVVLQTTSLLKSLRERDIPMKWTYGLSVSLCSFEIIQLHAVDWKASFWDSWGQNYIQEDQGLQLCLSWACYYLRQCKKSHFEDIGLGSFQKTHAWRDISWSLHGWAYSKVHPKKYFGLSACEELHGSVFEGSWRACSFSTSESFL